MVWNAVEGPFSVVVVVVVCLVLASLFLRRGVGVGVFFVEPSAAHTQGDATNEEERGGMVRAVCE